MDPLGKSELFYLPVARVGIPNYGSGLDCKYVVHVGPFLTRVPYLFGDRKRDPDLATTHVVFNGLGLQVEIVGWRLLSSSLDCRSWSQCCDL